MHPHSDAISTLTSLRDVTISHIQASLILPNFYSHISARCDEESISLKVSSQISTLTSLRDVTAAWPLAVMVQFAFLLSHLCEMWLCWGITSNYPTKFLLSHLCEMWPSYWDWKVSPRDFYSHISARCDQKTIEEQTSQIEISTLTSLRDVTAVSKVIARLNSDFYSHISARCDEISLTFGINGSDFYSHISARCDSGRRRLGLGTLGFLLSHLCEMWLELIAAANCQKKISTLTSLRDVTAIYSD